MSKTIRSFLLILMSVLFSIQLNAEEEGNITITGKILESGSSEPIIYATVTVYSLLDSLITGTVTQDDGSFEVKSPVRDFYIQVKYIGYKALTIDNFEFKGNTVDVATQNLEINTQELGEVEVWAETSQVEFRLDKRVFNVGQDLISAGGSALDVLNNVPSVDVNIEGEVSLRGNSNVQMLINGKPSVLTDGNSLGTITAEMIEKVEVITNPSAKHDAEGTTGIINIIIKKEDKKGLNGALSVNTGYPNNHSVGLSMNRRTEKFNLFSQFGIGKITYKPVFSGLTTDRTNENPSTFYNEGSGHKHEQFYNIILGTDYHINKWNVLTLSGHFGFEIEDQDSKTNYGLEEYDGHTSLISMREELTEATNPKYEYELNYSKTFARNKEQSLTAGATGSFFGKDSESLYTNTALGEGSVSPDQKIAADYGNAHYSFLVDYVYPFDEKSTFEVGAKYDVQQLDNDYLLENHEDGEWVSDPNYTNVFNYNQKVAASYFTYAWEPGKFGVKVGVRLEQTKLGIELETTNESNNQKYTGLFPSSHVSYKLSQQLSFQVGYSKRVSRPRWRSLNPFTSFRDNYNLSRGNPDLKPEYTDAFELTAIQIWENLSLNASAFYRYTADVVTSVIEVQDSLTVTHPANIGKSYDTGFELNGKVEPAKWLVFLLDSHFMAYKRKGQYEDQVFDFNSTSWSGRFTTKFKFPNDIDAEILVRHRSRYKDLQITSNSQTYADFGIKKKFMKGRAVLNFSVRDIFASRKSVNISDMPEFYRYNERMRDGRRFILSFSYGFGKGEAMEYSGKHF